MRLVIAAALALAAAPAAAQPAISLAPGETWLEIRAEGEAKSRPDMMTITAGAVSTGATAQEAMRAGTALTERMIAAIRRGGVEPRDVRTREMRVFPRFGEGENERADSEARPPRIRGYVASNALEVRFRDLNRAPEIMDALFAAGANNVDGPRFSLQDPAPAQRAAERDAIRKGVVEAENYAAALGKRVSRLLRVGERQPWSRDRDDAIVVTGSRMAPAIEPGEIATGVTVYMDFALTDQ
jgi:hypothetical protein